MAEVASAFVSLMPSAKGFGSSMNRQIGPQITSSAKTSGSRFGKVFAYSSMSPLKAIGAAAVGLFAVAKVKDFFQGAISEARESQKVSALTAQVIKSTGGAAQISAKQIGDMAGRLSALTGIDDEAIQGGENLLLTFKNIKNYVHGQFTGTFDDATGVMTDMSVALGQDMKSSAIQVGKALNDPVKGITALSRVGVSFTDQQKKQIETLVKSGKVTDAQRIILGELKSEFGGAAAAAATSGDKFHTAFANLQESVGLALLPLLDKLLDKGTLIIGFLINKVPAAFAAFKDAISPVTDAIGDLINNHLELFQGALAALSGAGIASVISLIGGGLVSALVALIGVLASPVVLLGALVGALIYAYQKSETFRQVVAKVVAWIQSEFIPGFLGVVEAVRGFAEQVFPIIQDAVSGLIDRLAPLVPRVVAVFQQIWSTIKDVMTLIGDVIKVVLAVLIWEWQHFGQNVLDFVSRTFSNIVTVISGVLNVIQGVVRLVLSLIKGDWSGAWDALKQIVHGVWQIISGLVSQAVAQLQLILSNAWVLIKAGASAAWDGIKKIPGLALRAAVAIIKGELNAIKSVAQAAWGAIKSAASAAWNAVKSVIQNQINAAKGVVSAAVGGIKSAMGGLADLVGKVRGWFGEIVSAVKSKLGDAVSFVKGFPGKVTSAIGDLGHLLFNAGASIVQGLIDGIQSKIGAVTSKLHELTSLIPLHKGPPAKDAVLLRPAGQLIMKGLVDGLDDGIKPMSKKLEEAGKKIRDSLKSTLDGLKSDFKSLKDSIASAFAGDLFNVSALEATSTDTHYFAAQTVGQVFDQTLMNTKTHLKELLRAFKKLKRWGLPTQFLSQLFASGNSDLILEMASGTQSHALAESALFGDVQALSDKLGGQVAKNQYGPQIKRLEDRLAEANKHLKHLDDLDKRIAKAVNGAVAHGQKKAS